MRAGSWTVSWPGLNFIGGGARWNQRAAKCETASEDLQPVWMLGRASDSDTSRTDKNRDGSKCCCNAERA